MPKPDMHGRTHCPGGSDPIPCLTGEANDYAWMRWAGSAAVTVNTLSSVSTLGGGLDYEAGFVSDTAVSSISLDLNTGIIQFTGNINNGFWCASGWALFNGGATAGSTLGVALDFGASGSFSTYRVGNMMVANAINEVFRIPVHRLFAQPTDHNSIRLLVYHDDAGGQDLNSAYLAVFRVNSSVAGTSYP